MRLNRGRPYHALHRFFFILTGIQAGQLMEISTHPGQTVIGVCSCVMNLSCSSRMICCQSIAATSSCSGNLHEHLSHLLHFLTQTCPIFHPYALSLFLSLPLLSPSFLLTNPHSQVLSTAYAVVMASTPPATQSLSVMIR